MKEQLWHCGSKKSKKELRQSCL